MVDQRIPIKNTLIYQLDSPLERPGPTDPDKVKQGLINAPSGNNVYIGASNYNRSDGVRTGDRGQLLSQYDSGLQGLYDGQIAHVRLWNQRLKDGTTGFIDGVGRQINLKPTEDESNASNPLGLSFTNFKSTSLTGDSGASLPIIAGSASNIAAWWYFNNMNGISGADISGGLYKGAAAVDDMGGISSNTGSVVGNGTIKLFDSRDLTLTSGPTNPSPPTQENIITDLQVSAIPRDYLYFDQPQINNPINNKITQGRLARKTIEGSIQGVGLVLL